MARAGSRCRIRLTVPGGYLDGGWEALHCNLAQTMTRLAAAVKPILERVTTRPPTPGAGGDEEIDEDEDE